MNWDAIGAFAEILGALAVFLSLAYLAIQTKQNTRALRSAAFHQVRASFSEVSLAMAQDPVITILLARAISDSADFSDEEIMRFSMLLQTIVRRGESAYFQSSDGTLQKDSWLGIKETLMSFLSNRLGREWWEEASNRFTSEYSAALSKALESREST